jgi:phage antirepressor YoqD-like protein
MPIQPTSFQILSPEQATPVLTGMKTMSEVLKTAEDARLAKQQTEQLNILNAISRPKIQYAPQMAESELNQALANIGKTKADIADVYQGNIPMKQAQAGYYGSETNLNKFKLKNPLLNTTGADAQLMGTLLYLAQNPEARDAFNNLSSGGQGAPSPIPQPTGGMPQQPIVQPQGWQQNISQALPQSPVPSQTQNTPSGVQSLFPRTGNPVIDNILSRRDIDTNLKMSRAQYFDKIVQTKDWALMPTDQREALLSQAAGLGVDPVEASQRFTKGETVSSMAISQGFDPKNMPEPIYPATKGSMGQIQMRKMALAEMKILQPFITDALAPYSRTIDLLDTTISPKMVVQAISGTDEDMQAKALAAKIIVPEMSAIRLRAMSGKQIGSEFVRDVTNASMNNLNQYHALISPSVFKKAQDLAMNKIEEAGQIANASITRNFSQMANATSDVGMQGNSPVGNAQPQQAQGNTAQAKNAAPVGTVRVLNGIKWEKREDGQWHK